MGVWNTIGKPNVGLLSTGFTKYSFPQETAFHKVHRFFKYFYAHLASQMVIGLMGWEGEGKLEIAVGGATCCKGLWGIEKERDTPVSFHMIKVTVTTLS